MSVLNPRQRFEIVEELQLLVETEHLNPSGYKNYAANPDGALGGWGWLATGGTLTTSDSIPVDEGSYQSSTLVDDQFNSGGVPAGWVAVNAGAPLSVSSGVLHVQDVFDTTQCRARRTFTGLTIGQEYTVSWSVARYTGTGLGYFLGSDPYTAVSMNPATQTTYSTTFTATGTSQTFTIFGEGSMLSAAQDVDWFKVEGSAWVPNIVDRQGIVWTAEAVADSHMESNGMPVTPGEWASAQFDVLAVTSGRNVKAHFNFYGVSGALAGSSADDVAITAAGHHQMVGVQIPANVVSCRLALGLYNGSGAPSAGDSFAATGVMLTKNATNTFGSIRSNLVPNPSFEVDIAGWAVEA